MLPFFDFGGSADNPGTEQDISSFSPNLRWKTNDNSDINTVDPIPRPPSGTVHSYWKNIYLKCTIAPDNAINNVQFFTDGTVYDAPNVVLYIGDQTPVKSSTANTGYSIATGTPGATGDEVVANNADISTKTLASAFVVGSTKGISISESGGIIDAVGETTNYMIFQLDVLSTATAGNTGVEVLSLQYDET